MFTKEVEEIKEALKNTLAIKAKMEELRTEYESIPNKLYIDFYSRSCTSSIYNKAIQKLNSVISTNAGLKQYYLQECEHYDNYESIIEESFNKVLSMNNQTILEAFNSFAHSRHSYEKKDRYTIKNDCIDLMMDFDYYKKLILNTLNILINGEIETEEVVTKINQVLQNDNTFIYRNIKITTYKNGKTKLVFGDDETLKKMINLLTNKEATI